MNFSIFLVLICLTPVLDAARSKREAYKLPDGADLLVGDVRTTFACSDDGYYADQDNFCQIFHVCHTVVNTNGKSNMMQWSFLCGNKTIFNQFSFTCSHPEDAVPCENSSDFWYLNDNLGTNVPFHNSQDFAKADPVNQGLPEIGAPQRAAAPYRPSPPTNFGGRK